MKFVLKEWEFGGKNYQLSMHQDKISNVPHTIYVLSQRRAMFLERVISGEWTELIREDFSDEALERLRLRKDWKSKPEHAAMNTYGMPE